MKWVDDFRVPEEVRALADAVRAEADPARQYRFMEFCGGHTHVLSRWGLTGLLPENVRMIHGPGCPVCVLPVGRIEMAAELALEKKAVVCTYADTLRVPAKKGRSLLAVKAEGGSLTWQPVSGAIGYVVLSGPSVVAVTAGPSLTPAPAAGSGELRVRAVNRYGTLGE